MALISDPDTSLSQTPTMPAFRQPSEKAAPQEWYAAPDLFDETTATPIPQRDRVAITTVAVPRVTAHAQSGNGKTPPTLTMLAAYGESERNASPEWPRRQLLVGLLLLVFFGVLGFGGWYWWTHRASVAQSPAQTDSTNAPAAADSSSSASSASSATTSAARITTGGAAEEEWKRLREKRIGA